MFGDQVLAVDLLNPSPVAEARKHKLKVRGLWIEDRERDPKLVVNGGGRVPHNLEISEGDGHIGGL